MVDQERLQKKLVAYIEDAHAMEQSVLSMLESMIRSAREPDIKAMLEEHRAQTEQHLHRLEGRLRELEEDPSGVKDMAAAAMAVPKAIFDQLRGEKAARNARDGYATEHLEIASYQLLERTAERAGDSKTAEIARTNRAEEEAMARRIEASWDLVLDQALMEDLDDGNEARTDERAAGA